MDERSEKRAEGLQTVKLLSKCYIERKNETESTCNRFPFDNVLKKYKLDTTDTKVPLTRSGCPPLQKHRQKRTQWPVRLDSKYVKGSMCQEMKSVWRPG